MLGDRLPKAGATPPLPLRLQLVLTSVDRRKKLGMRHALLWLGTAGRIDGCIANSRSVLLGRTDELGLGPSGHDARQGTSF